MKRSEAVIEGAPLVQALDEAMMSAVRAAAAATVGLIDLRREANLSPTVGADAWADLFATTTAAQEGLRSSLAFHARMSEVKAQMGCSRVVLNGGGDKNPTDPAFATEGSAQQLRLVG